MSEECRSAPADAASVEPVRVDVAGVSLDVIDFAGTLARIEEWMASPAGPCRQICTVNPEFVVDAQSNPEFAAALGRADLRVPDGIGVVLAIRLAGWTQRERVTGSDGIERISARAARRGWRVFYLGAAPGVAARAAQTLAARYPGLVVCGTYSGSPAARDWSEIHARLVAAEPDILLVAFGHPHQDLWIDRHKHDLPARVAVGVGGAFDFVAGVTQRAPVPIQRLGLEWLYRFIREPWRWRRMLKLPIFAGLVLKEKLGG